MFLKVYEELVQILKEKNVSYIPGLKKKIVIEISYDFEVLKKVI